MCTSLTLTASDHTVLLARTMDFPNVDPWVPTTYPANSRWQGVFGKPQSTQSTIIGASRHFNGHFLLGDGMNAYGLACAELYLAHAVTYYDKPQDGKINLTPQDFILWVLSGHQSVADVIADLPQVAIVAQVWFAENKVYPFHWILADKTGASVVIEPTDLTLRATPDPLGVLTNTPTLPDHKKRLLDYLEVTALASAPERARALIAANTPLPEGPVPTRRFIRTVVNRLGHPQPATGDEAVKAAFEYLRQVIIPRTPGVQAHNHNFTHYRSVMDLTHLRYYHIPTDTNQLKISSIS